MADRVTAQTMTIDQPWHSGRIIRRSSSLWKMAQRFTKAMDKTALAVEADHVAECMLRGEGASEFVSPDFSINTAYWLDRWREAGGVTYSADVLDVNGFDARPPRAGRYGAMPVLQLNGLEKSVSRLVLGTDNQIDAATMAAMADAFFEQGGTCFDTCAYLQRWHERKGVGAWIKARGMRENVPSRQGAHPPDCTPDAMARQLEESLDRLQTDYLDIYCLHRDNPDIPIAEWVDALHAEMDKGRIRVFGGSNWTAARIDAANEYAQSKGGSGFSLVSNNFSLARMEKPVWDGCLASSTDDFRDWHMRTESHCFLGRRRRVGFFSIGKTGPCRRRAMAQTRRLTRCTAFGGRLKILSGVHVPLNWPDAKIHLPCILRWLMCCTSRFRRRHLSGRARRCNWPTVLLPAILY